MSPYFIEAIAKELSSIASCTRGSVGPFGGALFCELLELLGAVTKALPMLLNTVPIVAPILPPESGCVGAVDVGEYAEVGAGVGATLAMTCVGT